MEDKDKVRLLAAAAMNACNQFIDIMFRDKDYEDLSTDEKLRIISVLKKNSKLYARYKA